MNFTTESFKIVVCDGTNGDRHIRISKGLTFTVEKSVDYGVDMSGKLMSQEIYDQYYKPEGTKKAAGNKVDTRGK